MKSRSPHASILALLKDRDIEKAVRIEERQSIITSSKQIKLIANW